MHSCWTGNPDEVGSAVALRDPLQSAAGNIWEITNVEGLVNFGNIPDYRSGSFFFCYDLQPISDNVRSKFAVAVFRQCPHVYGYALLHIFEINLSFINDPPIP
ncbi:MAG: hypothetical protein OXL40_03440 [Bacteroidota bacterium]|nr:hypothetical protein [Bacteroidota bacterium]